MMKNRGMVKIYRNSRILLPNVKFANCFGSRLRGLMFYPNWPDFDGLLIYPCNSIHMFWMNFPLDIVYLDRDGRILKTVAELAPHQIGPTVKNARYVLELPARSIFQCQMEPGQMLQWFANA